MSVGEMLEGSRAMAGGGSSNASWRDASFFVPSLPSMSVEEAGVGGSAGRGILVLSLKLACCGAATHEGLGWLRNMPRDMAKKEPGITFLNDSLVG